MNDMEAYCLGYAYRLVADALPDNIKRNEPARCAVKPIKGLLEVQRRFLLAQTPDHSIIQFLYGMHRRFQFDTKYNENAVLDEKLQWIWLMGYYAMDVDGFREKLFCGE